MEIKVPIPTFPPPPLLHSPRTINKRSLPKHDYSTAFRLILQLEKTVLSCQFVDKITPGEGSKGHAYGGDRRFAVRQDGAKRGRRGYDAGKKIKGRKRHIAVDTEGNLLTVVVHSAGIQDRVAARAVLIRLFCRFDSITKVFVDGGYSGKLIGWSKEMFGYDVDVVQAQ